MKSPSQPDQIKWVRKHFKQSLSQFDSAAEVFNVVSGHLIERLQYLAVKPVCLLDLGSRSGYQLTALQQQYPNAFLVATDPAPAPVTPAKWFGLSELLTRQASPSSVASDPHQLPFADESFDVVTSNLLLPWMHSVPGVMEEVRRVLRSDGVFLFTTLGPDTLIEYIQAWSAIDRYEHSFGLADMHDIGDALLAAGFAAPVMDRDLLRVDYPSVASLEQELRALGAANIAMGRRRGLMAPTVREQLHAIWSPGRCNVCLEVVHGHAWCGDLKPLTRSAGKDIKIPTSSVLKNWRKRR